MLSTVQSRLYIRPSLLFEMRDVIAKGAGVLGCVIL